MRVEPRRLGTTQLKTIISTRMLSRAAAIDRALVAPCALGEKIQQSVRALDAYLTEALYKAVHLWRKKQQQQQRVNAQRRKHNHFQQQHLGYHARPGNEGCQQRFPFVMAIMTLVLICMSVMSMFNSIQFANQEQLGNHQMKTLQFLDENPSRDIHGYQQILRSTNLGASQTIRTAHKANKDKTKLSYNTPSPLPPQIRSVLDRNYVPVSVPYTTHDTISTAFENILNETMSMKARLQKQHIVYDPIRTQLKARRSIYKHLECDPKTVRPSDIAKIRLVSDGGIGLTISQALFAINMAISRNLIPIFDDQELLWFSSRKLSIGDIFNLPCNPPAHVRDSSRVQKANCDDASCDRRLAKAATTIPLEFAHLPLMWWWRQLTLTVIRPSENILGHMAKILKKNRSPVYNPMWNHSTATHKLDHSSPFARLFNMDNLERPLVAVHLRRGDACTGDRPTCISSASEVFELLEKKNINRGTLLVATDSAQLLESMENTVSSEGNSFQGKVISLKADRNYYGNFYKKDMAYEDISKTQNMIQETNLALEAILDLVFLAEGEIHVGSFFSNFIRSAMNLSGKNHAFRYISFDAHWCPHEICSLGWITRDKCPLYHRHMCQWRPTYMCNSTSLGDKCNRFAGSLSSDQCNLFYQNKDMFRLSWIKSQALQEVSPILDQLVNSSARYSDVCCSTECFEETSQSSDGSMNDVHGCSKPQRWLKDVIKYNNPELAWEGYTQIKGFTPEVLRTPRENYFSVISEFQARVARVVTDTINLHPVGTTSLTTM